jgi:hypothetical protein
MAFAACVGLESITIPESLTNIGDYAFYGCSQLTSDLNEGIRYYYTLTSYDNTDKLLTASAGYFSAVATAINNLSGNAAIRIYPR